MSTSVDVPAAATRDRLLSPVAWFYLLTVLVGAGAIGALTAVGAESPQASEWLAFALIGGGAAIAQIFVVNTVRNQSYHLTIALLAAGALVLPPELLLPLAVVQHVPEWLKVRYPWYIQTFNIANYALDLLAAAVVARAVLDSERLGPDLRVALAGLLAALVLVVLNHTVLAFMLRLGRGHSLRETGLFSVENLSMDLVLALLGVVVAYAWLENPWLVVPALCPLVLMYRSLAVPQLRVEARVDPKTGLYNARHFSAELHALVERARRTEQVFSVLMIDLELLREINNTHGHLAGDEVLEGIARLFRVQLRDEDVPTRFGGEEFAVLLPESGAEEALAVAERIRLAIAEESFKAPMTNEQIRATVSIGIASFPEHGTDVKSLVHQADLAVYRAKIQGRNRVIEAGSEPFAPLAPLTTSPVLVDAAAYEEPLVAPGRPAGAPERRAPKPLKRRLKPSLVTMIAGTLGGAGVAAGAFALALAPPSDAYGLLAIALLVASGQALALQLENGSISVGAVGSLAGAALFGPGAALALAFASVSVDAVRRRPPLHKFVFNAGALTLAGLASAGLFAAVPERFGSFGLAILGVVAGALYFAVNTGLLSVVIGLEEGARPFSVWRERYSWLSYHYVAWGFVGAVVAIAYGAAELYALAAFAIPLLLMRVSQASYIRHTAESTAKLREAARTIKEQNVSLGQANDLLRQRSLAALEGLSATVDARDDYTAGHSRRVQTLTIQIATELGLSGHEVEVLGYAALFHDIGKLAIPDSILLKPGTLTEDEMALMRGHVEEGAAIVDRLSFLADAVPTVRHHHERFDGGGYPDGLKGNDIPLGGRIVHVADALDSMMRTRIYRPGRPLDEAISELKRERGHQFCPLCVDATLRILERDSVGFLRGREPMDRVA